MESDDGLSWEEKNRLYGLAFIPFFVVFLVVMVYFLFYLVNYEIVEGTLWNGIIYVILPLFLIGLPSTFLAFEILYHRKIKQPFSLHVKRFSGRVLLTIPAGLSFCGALILSDIFLSPIVGKTHTAIVGGTIWMVGFFIFVTSFREFFSQLDKGEW